MHLQNRPTYFVKDGNRKAVYYTVDARELTEDGWVIEQDATAVSAKPPAVQPKPVQGVTGPQGNIGPTGVIELDLDGMTRAELVEFAEANEIEFKSNAPKADILEACKEFTDD